LPNPSIITNPAKTANMIRIMKCVLVGGIIEKFKVSENIKLGWRGYLVKSNSGQFRP
jgi:hypothetical protein